MTFGGSNGEMWRKIGTLQQDAVDGIVRSALAAGINFIDTADVYSYGESETLLGQSLRNLGVKRSDVVIATKVYSQVGEGPNDRGASRGHIMDSVRTSLDRLQTDHIDLYQIHGTDPVTPLDETIRALDRPGEPGAGALRRRVELAGLADHEGARHCGASWLDAVRQPAGLLHDRRTRPGTRDRAAADRGEGGADGLEPAGRRAAVRQVRPGSNGPEDSRRASFDFPPVERDRAWACVAAMRKIGDAHGVSVARVALAWLLAKPYVSTVIIGAKTPEQLTDNIAATTLSLSAEELAALDAVSALPEEYPGWMLGRQGANRRPAPFTPG